MTSTASQLFAFSYMDEMGAAPYPHGAGCDFYTWFLWQLQVLGLVLLKC